MKVCKICGETEENTKIIKNLCRRHYLQLYRHGKIFKTIYDKNDFIEHDDCFEIVTRDKCGNKTNSFFIDKDDYDKCKNKKWYNKNGYARTSSDTPRYFLHELLTNNFGTDFDTDHIDGDTTNNKKKNLRIVEHKTNIRNMHKEKIRGIKLVSSGNYQASITVDYSDIYLGTFNTKEDAIKARREAEINYFGEYVN